MPRDRCRPSPSPFCSACHSHIFYASPIHQEALARLHFLVGEQRSLGVLTGGDGSGKSLLLATFRDELPSSEQPACLVNLMGLEPRDLLGELAVGLRAQARTSDDVYTLWQRISERLRANHLLRLQTTVLLDDADEAAHEVLILVLRLLKSQPAGLTLVLAADPARMTRLGGDLLQLSQLRIHLEPWEPDDVREYLQASLARVGGHQQVFDEAAVERLYALSNGVPRWVAHLAELTWLAAADGAWDRIGAETVESAYQALSASYYATSAR